MKSWQGCSGVDAFEGRMPGLILQGDAHLHPSVVVEAEAVESGRPGS